METKKPTTNKILSATSMIDDLMKYWKAIPENDQTSPMKMTHHIMGMAKMIHDEYSLILGKAAKENEDGDTLKYMAKYYLSMGIHAWAGFVYLLSVEGKEDKRVLRWLNSTSFEVFIYSSPSGKNLMNQLFLNKLKEFDDFEDNGINKMKELIDMLNKLKE